MVIQGLLEELGATYRARKIADDELVFGVGVIKVDENKSYLIQRFETDDMTDGVPALAYYAAVKTDSIVSYNKYDSKTEIVHHETNTNLDGKGHSLVKKKR